MSETSLDEKDRIKRINANIHLIKKQFECPICIDFFESPVVTNCQHAFCRKCIVDFIGKKRSQNCPLCKKNINSRSLTSFGMLEKFVSSAKKLVEVNEKELGIESTSSHNTSSCFSLLNELQNKQISVLDKHDQSTSSSKRKRSPSDELNVSKKKKLEDSEASNSNKKRINRKKKSNEKLVSSGTVHDLNKVNEWLNNNQNVNPFNCTGPKQVVVMGGYSQGSSCLTAEASSSGVSSKTPDIESAAMSSKETIQRAKKLINENDLTKPDMLTKLRLRFPTVSSFRKQFRIKYIFRPLKFSAKSKLLKSIIAPKLEVSTKLDHIGHDSMGPPIPSTLPIIINNSSIELNDNMATTSKKVCENTIEQTKQRPRLKRVSDQIRLKQRQFIKFYYHGTTRQKNAKKNENSSSVQTIPIKIIERVNSATNTSTPELVESTTQTEPLRQNHHHEFQTAVDKYMNDFHLIENDMIERIFQEIESDVVNELVTDKIDQIEIKAAKGPNLITETPPVPNQTNKCQSNLNPKTIAHNPLVIPDTIAYNPLVIPDTIPIHIEQITSNFENQKMKSIDQFSDLLDSSKMSSDKKSKKLLFKRDRLPTLEFLKKPEESTNSNLMPGTPTTKKTLHSRFLINNNLVISDTPQKSEDTSLDSFKELNSTLSKSASRVEFADSRVLENSNSRIDSFEITNNRTRINSFADETKNFDMTMAYEHKDINETTYNQTAHEETDIKIEGEEEELEKSPRQELFIESEESTNKENESSKTSTKSEAVTIKNSEKSLTASESLNLTKNNENQQPEPIHSPKPLTIRTPFKNKTNSTLMLDSMDTTTNIQPTDMSTTFNQPSKNPSILNKGPPPAADILGLSYMGSNSMSILPTNTSIMDSTSSKETRVEEIQSVELPKDHVFKVPSITAFKPDSLETQLLTDSELFVIDNLCKDMYSVHNQTIDATNTDAEPPVGVLSVSKKQVNKIEFVCSLLKPDKKDMLRRFAKFIKATVTDDITKTTTHLVVESDEHFICGVTSKYLKAISRKIWIVSILWILQSINQNKLLDPAAFEIRGDGIFGSHNGPKLARLSTTDIFANYEFLFIGKFESESINLDGMIKLANANGAHVVRKAKDFSDNKIRTVLFDEKLQKISVKNANFMLESAKIFSVTTSWLLDSLACYSIRDMKLYALYKQD